MDGCFLFKLVLAPVFIGFSALLCCKGVPSMHKCKKSPSFRIPRSDHDEVDEIAVEIDCTIVIVSNRLLGRSSPSVAVTRLHDKHCVS